MHLTCPRCKTLLEIPDPSDATDLFQIQCGDCQHRFRIQLNRPSLRFRRPMPRNELTGTADLLPGISDLLPATGQGSVSQLRFTEDFTAEDLGIPGGSEQNGAISSLTDIGSSREEARLEPEILPMHRGEDAATLRSPPPETGAEGVGREGEGDLCLIVPFVSYEAMLGLELIVLTAEQCIEGRKIVQQLGQLSSTTTVVDTGEGREAALLEALQRVQRSLREKACILGAGGVIALQVDTLGPVEAPALRLRGTAVRLSPHA